MREVDDYLKQRMVDAKRLPLYPQNACLRFEITDVLKATEKKACFLATCDGGQSQCVIKAAYQGLDVEYRFMTSQSRAFQGLIPYPIAYWEDNGKQYLIRQFVEGKTLDELYRAQAPLSFKRLKRITNALSASLEMLHDIGLVHRDLKPENILWTSDDACVLIDMETVRSPTPGKPSDTVSLGTPAYASPEQLCDRQTDARSDVYGLGRILLYLVTGSDAEEDAKALKGRMGRIIRRSIAFAPEKRYPSIKAVREAVNGRRALKTGFCCLILCALLALAGSLSMRNLHFVGNRSVEELLASAPKDQTTTLFFTQDITLDQTLDINGCDVIFTGNATLHGDHDENATVRIAPGASLRVKDGIVLQTERTGTVVDNHGTFILDGGVLRLSGETQGLVGVYNERGTVELLRGSIDVDSKRLSPDGFTLCVHNHFGTLRMKNAHLSNLNCFAVGGVLLNQGGHCEISGGTLFAGGVNGAAPFAASNNEGGVMEVTGGEFSPEFTYP